MTDLAALYEDDRVVAIFPRHRRRQAEHVSSPCLPLDGLETHGGQVMAFVDDDMPIVGDQLFSKILAAEEDHVEFIQTQLDLISKIGIENYIQLQSGHAE